MDWAAKNPDWYPEEVVEGRSAGLVKFIDEFLKGTRKALESNESMYWNNLTSKQRAAITTLAKDSSIVIKPSDKCGSVVIMNTRDYEQACLNVLTNEEHYEELPNNPNPTYKATVQEEIESLKNNDLISDLEYDNLSKGSRTPFFYGLPKMHNPFNNFPSLRPISSGTDSCTARLSESLTLSSRLRHRKYLPISKTPPTSYRRSVHTHSQPTPMKSTLPPWMSSHFTPTSTRKKEQKHARSTWTSAVNRTYHLL
jgi:hypothetical protein